jgi:serine/threonine protein kinase
VTQFSPESFGRYFLVDKIAVGGMAEVFKAKTFSHGGFEKLLVIKRILEHLSENDEFVEMFIDEAKISVELQHPNIIQIYDFGRIHHNYYIAMECVEGKDVKGILRKLAERRKLMPTEYALYIAHEMCKGLEYAHKRPDAQGEMLGIVHRDISPSNILASYSGEVKIADFGIAKARISGYNTRDGVLKGKFEYMSPEQASGQDIDARSDLFATGIILHEMLTGRRLFKTNSDIKTLERIKAVAIKPPSHLNPSVPKRLDDLVMKALSKDPADRFQDARAFQGALLEFMYPATPDLTRENLGHFMTELFSSEIKGERDRLEEGTRLATELFDHAPEIDLAEEWVEEAGSGQTITTQPSRLPLFLAVLGVVLLGALGVWFAQQRAPPPTVVEVVASAPEAPKPGAMHIRVKPDVEARIFIDGTQVTVGHDWVQTDLPSDRPFEVRIEADGYETYKESHEVALGERLRLPITLARPPPPPTASPTPPTAPTEAPPPVAAPPPRPGKLSVNVRGGWAEVYVDGRRIDTTPLYNHNLSAGRHTVMIVNGATGERKTRAVTIIPGETTRVTF